MTTPLGLAALNWALRTKDTVACAILLDVWRSVAEMMSYPRFVASGLSFRPRAQAGRLAQLWPVGLWLSWSRVRRLGQMDSE